VKDERHRHAQQQKQVADRRAGHRTLPCLRGCFSARRPPSQTRRRRIARLIVAAAVATAMMNLYVDVQAKLRTEFRELWRPM